MKTQATITILTISTCLLALIGCQTPDPVNGDDTGQLTQHSAISDCGGFEGEVGESRSGGYCDAEVLAWEYDAATQTLELVDRRVSLNCCGDRSVGAEFLDGALVITEIDEPGEIGRCRCMCVFDYSLTLEGIEEGLYDLDLLRAVTEDGADASLIWGGTLDLSLGSGEIELDDEPVMGECSESR